MSQDELAATKAELAKLQAKYDHLLLHATAKSAISNALPLRSSNTCSTPSTTKWSKNLSRSKRSRVTTPLAV